MTTFLNIIVETQDDCGNLDSIGMGSVNRFEGVAKYQCEKGYRIEEGNETRFCEDGTWNGVAPVCVGLYNYKKYASCDLFVRILMTIIYRSHVRCPRGPSEWIHSNQKLHRLL